jgi:hypothetical protein
MAEASSPHNSPPPSSHLAADDPSRRSFRFYDNRQKYLLFVSTCSEKWVIAERVGLELATCIPNLQLCGFSMQVWAMELSSLV